MGLLMLIHKAAGQLGAEISMLVDEEQLVAVNGRDSGDGFRRFAVAMLCKPGIPSPAVEF